MTLRRRGYLNESKEGTLPTLGATLALAGLFVTWLMNRKHPSKWHKAEVKTLRKDFSELSKKKQRRVLQALDQLEQKEGSGNDELIRQISIVKGYLRRKGN